MGGLPVETPLAFARDAYGIIRLNRIDNTGRIAIKV